MVMSRAYNVIDSDGHILEPLSLWADYMDPTLRDRAPRLERDSNGRERLLIGEKMLGGERGMAALGAVGRRDGTVVVDDARQYADGRKGGFDPHARIPDMDLDGIDAAYLYPSIGLFAGSVEDPKLSAAICRAYNRWLAEYCAPYPDRLFGIAMLPMQHVDMAIEEMRFARQELGMPGVFLRPNPYNNKMVHDPSYDRFWSAVEDFDVAVGFHEGGSSGMPQVGLDRFETTGARHIVTHTMEMMMACLSMICGGVCDRHPKLRVAFLESGGGWIVPWLERMDRHYVDQGFNDSGLSMKPSEIFQRNCWISFEPVEGSLRVLADYIGPHKILWATDYPHPDGFFPGAPDMVRKNLEGLSAETRQQVMAGGAKAFYNLH
jgi:predicted TIM-barrel fold metal-dependent hydrolase